jgi:hypothetical protein
MRLPRLLQLLVLTVAFTAPVSLAHADPFHVADYTLGPTTPGKWGAPVYGTPGGVVTWSIMAGGVDLVPEGVAATTSVSLATIMPAGYLAAIQAAFDAWEAVANIDFLQIGDGGEAFNSAGTSGQIRVGAHAFDGPSGTLAHGYFPPNNGTTAAGDIHFDSAEDWDIGFAGPGFDIFQVMAHEIGHAIGLNHTGVANQLMNSGYSEAFSGPQADDIAGAQFLYGAPVEIDPEPVPEPGTFLLLGAGVVALVRLRQRAR